MFVVSIHSKEVDAVTTTVRAPATYSVPEAARLLGISRSSAFEAARRGDLPGAIRIGHRVVVSRRVLERVLNGEPTEATA
jgi:predicted DNA-binding transcriptional regulator AlpA